MERIQDRTVYPYFWLKRSVDIGLSFCLIVLSWPLVLVVVILIRLESKGSAFYKQERVGHLGKPMTIIKLRSMAIDAEKNGAQWASKTDNRVTRVGKFIRQTRIDELPQLWNVLKGEMSFVGPRPERDIFIEEFLKTIPNFNDRLQVLPGLTGLAQINGGYDISPEEKLKWDLIYIDNYGFKQDLMILLNTIKVVLTGDGAR